MLLGEPSPSLAKINEMNIVKLTAKIASLAEEEAQLVKRLTRLNELDPPPADKIQTVTDLLKRLVALKAAAEERLAGKLKRKAEREQGLR